MAEADRIGGGIGRLTDVERHIMLAAESGKVATLGDLGGMDAIASEAERLKRSPLLPELARTFTVSASQSSSGSESGHDALAKILLEGLIAAESAFAFSETLDVLLDSEDALGNLGEQISGICLARVAQRREHPGMAGIAIECALRVALGGWVPEFDLLGTLVRLREPESHLFSRPALRCLGVAYERWRDERFVQAMSRLAGLEGTIPASLSDEVQLIESDAALELAHAALLDAFTAPDITTAAQHLDTARRRFSLARVDEDRVDARLMTIAVEMLTVQLPSADPAIQTAETLRRLADELRQILHEHQLGYAGLNGWRGARLDAEVAWTGLALDVAAAGHALTQRSWYEAARTLTDVICAYQATRCVNILGKKEITGLRMLLAPRITHGIGHNAALLTHLEDHVRALEESMNRAGGVFETRDAEDELHVARELLEAARGKYSATGSDIPKAGSATSLADPRKFPTLASLVPEMELAALAAASADSLSAIEAALAERSQDSISGSDSLILSEIFSDCQQELLKCPDYQGEVKSAFNQFLQELLRFAHFASQRGASRPGGEYLFRADALESELAHDVDRFLASSPMGYRVHTEVHNIGGGRADIAVLYDQFTLVCELKREFHDLSPKGQRKHLLQAAAYQDHDVALGFLLVLDLRKRTGPPPHLRANVHVIVLDDEALGYPRYVVMLAVPGNRTVPSSAR